jgi:hypothetical protein
VIVKQEGVSKARQAQSKGFSESMRPAGDQGKRLRHGEIVNDNREKDRTVNEQAIIFSAHWVMTSSANHPEGFSPPGCCAAGFVPAAWRSGGTKPPGCITWV